MSSDAYVFSTDTLPSDDRFLPPLANGLLGWRVFSDRMHMGGIYNGEAGECHRADLPCPLAVRMKLEEPGTDNYSLDTRSGVFSHSMTTASVCATQSFYAHRQISNMLVMEVMLARQVTSEEPITVELLSSFTPSSDDVVFQPGPDYKGGRHIEGQTKAAEVQGDPCPSVHLIWHPVDSSLTLQAGQSQSRWGFIMVAASTAESAEGFFDRGLELMESGNLRHSHCQAWTDLWAGSRVELTGPEALTRAVIGCLFYLLSALPPLRDAPSQFWGISPGGLSNGRQGQDYWGHVFWDQDTWMYPSIALFQPNLAQAVLKYRVQTLGGAKVNAAQLGCKGIKFPWESAVTGTEVCPEDIYGKQEIHINGDVIMAFQHYLYLTQDLALFREGRGDEVVWGVAEYWVSRVTWNAEEQCYHIKAVMPPDEYYSNVDNSVYTNAVAKYSLLFAVELASLLQRPVPPEWQEVAEKIKIPFDPEVKYHPEFDGYKKGSTVKQADVVLLGYPLGLPMSPEVRRNDLELYEAVTDPKGPAMTWSMFAVGWLELGDAERAQKLLDKCFSHIQGPFQVWSEVADSSGTVNFLTGMGGFLQAVIFGYTGFRVRQSCLTFAPLLPDDITELNVSGVDYLGNKLDWVVKRDEVSVCLREEVSEHTIAQRCPLQVVLKNSGTKIPLVPGKSATFPREPGEVRKLESAGYCLLL